MDRRSACAVFGTGSGNHETKWVSEEQQRAKVAAGLIAGGVNYLVCVGGEKFENGGRVVTEALSMWLAINSQMRGVPSGVDVRLEERGVETVEQVENTLGILQADGFNDRLHVVSSWHQLARLGMLFGELGGVSIKPHVGDGPGLNRHLGHETWHCLAGYTYSWMLLWARRHGVWQDGGPVIGHYRRLRQNRVK